MPVPNGTLTFNEVCEEACRNTSIEPSIMKAAVAEYMKTVQANVLKGFQLRGSEESKIECARRHFKAISDNGYIYDVAKDYKSLYDIVTK